MKKTGSIISSFAGIKAALGRGMADIPSECPKLFRGADKICLVTGSDIPASVKRKALILFPGNNAPSFRYALPPSEKAKTLEQAGKLCSFLFQKGFTRNSMIIAVGGGAVTDLAGFAASIYMRGIKWVSVPTTFLGQIDAGLGGKTAVNLGGAKNIAGTFHMPALTVCDTSFLDSLPRTELRSGAGELVKYAMIGRPVLRRAVMKNLSRALAGDKKALTACVTACAAYKLGLVAGDERDENGAREILNFGHTAGHAFEAMSGGRLPHGMAVARGISFALISSRETGLLDDKNFCAMKTLISELRLPPTPVRYDLDTFLGLISRDKKARGVENRFVLLKDPGRPLAVENLAREVLEKAFHGALE